MHASSEVWLNQVLLREFRQGSVHMPLAVVAFFGGADRAQRSNRRPLIRRPARGEEVRNRDRRYDRQSQDEPGKIRRQSGNGKALTAVYIGPPLCFAQCNDSQYRTGDRPETQEAEGNEVENAEHQRRYRQTLFQIPWRPLLIARLVTRIRGLLETCFGKRCGQRCSTFFAGFLIGPTDKTAGKTL